jgi:carbonic anhydrase/acetyltransferase-like protein (isoleucine patch superfamily)
VILIPLYLLMIVSFPAFVAFAPVVLSDATWARLVWAALVPVTYGLVYVLVAGLLSLRHQHAIKPGRFKRSLSDPAYAHRRLYGLCWTSVYYFTPLYFVILSAPPLKTAVFRLFGYRGNTDFTIYPDTWIRDLPLHSFGKGAYIANRATLATNIVLGDGSLLVDRVHVGNGSLVGHLTMLAPGFHIGQQSEVGVGTAIGLRTRLGDNVKIGPVSGVDNGAIVDDGATVGTWCHIGSGARILSGAHIPSGTRISRRTVVQPNSVFSEGHEHE